MPSDPMVVRITGPGELAVLIPTMLDFTPTESLVILSLRGERERVGLIQRIDLPREVELPDEVLEVLVARAVQDKAAGIMAAIWTESPDRPGRPHEELVRRLSVHAERAGIDLREALLVRDGRWWSYICGSDLCCPPEGTPLSDSADSPAVVTVAAERAFAGRSMLATRDELERSIAPRLPFGLEFAVERLFQRRLEQLEALERDGEAARDELVEAWAGTFSLCRDPRNQPDEDKQISLIASLVDPLTRDEVVRLMLAEPRGERRHIVALFESLCRHSVPPFDATLCHLLAWSAYLEGGGAMVTIALDRALRDDPEYGIALDTMAMLQNGNPPRRLEAILRHCYLPEIAQRDQDDGDLSAAG